MKLSDILHRTYKLFTPVPATITEWLTSENALKMQLYDFVKISFLLQYNTILRRYFDISFCDNTCPARDACTKSTGQGISTQRSEAAAQCNQ